MKALIASLALLAGISGLAACGFSPVHSSTGIGKVGSSNIHIPEIRGRAGHALRKALLQELDAGLPDIEDATLTVTMRQRLRRLSIRPDEAAARTDIIATGRYVLDTGEDAISGRAAAESSFNVPISAFGDIASQTAAAERVAGLLAQRIADDLKLKLTRPAEEPEPVIEVQ